MILLQITQPVQDAVPQTLTFFELMLKGGPVLIPIFILSVICIYIIIERFLTITNASKIDQNFITQIKHALRSNDLQSAKMLASSTPVPLARIINKGLSRVGRPYKEIESALESAASVEIRLLEKRMGVLGIIAGIAPMLGFIGTIAGIINIFFQVSLADNISIGLISTGLYQKMISSFSGLLVGVVAYAAYHYLSMMIDNFASKTEVTANDLMDTFYQPASV